MLLLLFYSVSTFVCSILFSFLAGITGFADDQHKRNVADPGNAWPAGLLVFIGACLWPLTLLGLLTVAVIGFGNWIRTRIKEELKE